MRTPADRAHRASSRKYPSVRESLACRSCQTAYCRIATPGIPPPRVTSPHGAQAQSDSLVVADVLSAQFGVDLNVFSRFLAVSTGAIINTILLLTGNT